MAIQFTEGQRYLGLIKVIKRGTGMFDKSTMIINHINDQGHLTEFYFFSDITKEVDRYNFKMIPGQLITFEVIGSKDGFYRFHATSLKLFERDSDYQVLLTNRDENTYLKNFALAFNTVRLEEIAKSEADKFRTHFLWLNEVNAKVLLNDILDQIKVKVKTWGRNKIGGDDTWAADLDTDFGKYDSSYHNYLRKSFRFYRELFYERGYCPYRQMLEEYENSDDYSRDTQEAEVQTARLKSKLVNEYNFEEHLALFRQEIRDQRNKALQQLYARINSSWESVYKDVRFLNYYDRYLNSSLEFLSRLQADDLDAKA